MDVTLLCTREAPGVPASSPEDRDGDGRDRRRRPGLLVESGDATVLLDAPPGVSGALAGAGVADVDAVFLTHHRDRTGGLRELNHGAVPAAAYSRTDELATDGGPGDDVLVYRAGTANGSEETGLGVPCRAESRLLDRGRPVPVGDLRVVPFPVENGRPGPAALGLAVRTGGPMGNPELVYAPDLRRWLPGERAGRTFEEPSLLVASGAGLSGAKANGPAGLADALAAADADRTVLVDTGEHLAGAHTAELARRADEHDHELGANFETYAV